MQKSILLACLACLLTATATAQDCNNYYLLQNNKTIEITIYNKKGAVNGKQVYTVTNVKNGGSSVTANLHSEMFDKKGKSQAKGTSVIECNGGVMMVDMKMLLPQQQQEQFSKAEAKVDKYYLEYPASMSAGDKLKDGNFNMDMETGGMKQNITMIINNRKVEGKESVTTPAGTWDCFKISYNSKITVKTMGIGVPVSFDGTEWYAPGFGIVKTESRYGATEITSIK